MIATCTKCRAMFFTTEEDACTPGVLCVECFRQELRNDRLDEAVTAAADGSESWPVLSDDKDIPF